MIFNSRNKKTLKRIISAFFVLLTAIAVVVIAVSTPVNDSPDFTQSVSASPTNPPQITVSPTMTIPTNIPTQTTTPTPQPTPTAETYILSFAGDCTLGTEHDVYGWSGTFVHDIADNYDLPFQNVANIFKADDFTLVNLEGAFTNLDTPAEKEYRFKGPPEYAKILTAGGIECVSLANNHTSDYGKEGLNDTMQALDAEGVSYAYHETTCLYTTDRGLVIGVYAAYYINEPDISRNIAYLKDNGADVIIAAFHWGIERSYEPSANQISYARIAIDNGADIVVGHHPHVLQKIEYYNGKPILYSLGNFSFGGNRNPPDKDTVIVQLNVTKEPNGTVICGDLNIIPCSISSVANRNDYCPTPLAEDSDAYKRVLKKLAGEWYVAPPSPEPTPTPEPTIATDPASSPETPEQPNGETGETPEISEE